MNNLQVTFEIAVNFGHFFNIDIFQRGFYHVTIEFEDSELNKSNIEVHLINGKIKNDFMPASVSSSKAMSKTVQILHKCQEVALDETFLFRCHRLVESQNILNSVSAMKFFLVAKLRFCGNDDISCTQTSDFEEVSSRTIQLLIDPVEGLHGYTLLVFEYGYMAGIELVCHASLVALHQPLLQTLQVYSATSSANIETVTLESILFPNLVHLNTLAKQVSYAVEIHNSIVNILYAIYTHLKTYLSSLCKHSSENKYSNEFADALIKISKMEASLKLANGKEELLDQVNMNLASTCSYVLALWSHILEKVCLNRNVITNLALLYHKQRIQRFRSLFFTTDNPRYLFDEDRSGLYNFIASDIRSSSYFSSVPPLCIETFESDGVSNPLPILFEDKFLANCNVEPKFEGKFNRYIDPQHKIPASGTSVPQAHRIDVHRQFQSGATKFSQDIISQTLEEPDDLPSFNSLLPANPVSSSTKTYAFSGPGFKETKSPLSNFGTTHVTKDSTPSTSNCTINTIVSTLREKEIVSNGEESTKNKVSLHSLASNVSTKCSQNEDLLTLEAFLEEDLDFSLLHDTICEPSNMLFANKPCKTCRYFDDEDNNIFEVISVSSSRGSLFFKLHSKHLKEKKKLFDQLRFPGHLYSDIDSNLPLSPYLNSSRLCKNSVQTKPDSHLIVLVHGLDGSSTDMRTVKTFLQLGLEATLKMSGQLKYRVNYLLSTANEKDTYNDIQIMTNKLVDEILHYIKVHYFSSKEPKRISFIGHSLGGLLIRSAITSESLRHLRPRFHTILTFSSPHLGTIFNDSTLINTGLWLMQKFKKSTCLRQLSCKENSNFKNTFIYKLSKKPGLEFFKNILLVASADDRYVPYQSARMETCKSALKDKSLGTLYEEMINNILRPVLEKSDIKFLRYHVVHSLMSTTANALIGRAAHIAVLESEVFLEQFFLVTALQYFV